MKHIAPITKATTSDTNQEEVMAILDRIFEFALQVIQAKGKGSLTAR